MLPAEWNIEIYRGDSWQRHVAVTDADEQPVDLTSVEIRAQVRGGGGKLVAEFSIEKDPLETNRFRMFLLPETSAALSQGRHEWDLEFRFSPTDVRTWARGSATITKDVTQPA